MDWDRAKNYTVVFLVALNLFLFVCNIWSDSRYILTSESVDSIKNILLKNGITVDAELPENYMPMRQIRFSEPWYDIIELQEIFFRENKNIRRTEEFEKTILTSGDETISIFGGKVYYQKRSSDMKQDFSEKSVMEICRPYVEKINEAYTEMTLDNIKRYEDYFIVQYIQRYKGFNIFNNYIRFTVFKDGSLEAEFKYNNVKGMFGNKMDVCSADEALFIFSDEIKKISDLETITVNDIEQGYFFEKSDDRIAAPYYRILIEESHLAFYVNAYNSTFSSETE